MHKLSIIILFLLNVLGMALYSCDDELEYETGQNAEILFSEDTIDFDTVFTTIASSTRRFKVYNPSEKAVLLPKVELATLGESGFRINVDGVHANTFADVEILGKDSIYVFVEITAKKNSSLLPEMVKDSIIFTLPNGRQSHVKLRAMGQDAEIMRGVTICSDTIFSSGVPRIIYDSLVVSRDASLTLEAGTVLCFHKNAGLKVYGRLSSKGTLGENVVMRGDRTDKLLPYLPYDRLDSQWEGVTLMPESVGNQFEYTDIHGGRYGIDCQMSGIETYKLIMNNSVIHNVAGDGLSVKYSAVRISNTQITNAGGNCVTIIGGYADFTHCTIAQFYPWNSVHGSALFFTNILNDTIYPLEKAHFYNSVITGSANDEIFGQKLEPGEGNPDADNVPFNCRFTNCLINTVIKDGDDYFVDCSVESSDSAVYGASNFRLIDNSNYTYDFRPDSLSRARFIASPVYSSAYPSDRLGVARPSVNPDAGCYQWTESIK